MVMKNVEIRIYGKGTKYNRKRCDKKIVMEIESVKIVDKKKAKELEKTMNDDEYDEHGEYYNITYKDGESNYFRASHTKIIEKGHEMLLNMWDVIFSEKYYHHHTATAKDYLRSCDDGMVEEYSGRFGVGYIIHRQMNSSKYHLIEYYIKKGE